MFISQLHNTQSKFSGKEASSYESEVPSFDLDEHKSKITKLIESKQTEISNMEGFVNQMVEAGKTPAPFLLSMLDNMKSEKSQLVSMLGETNLVSNYIDSKN